MMHFQPIEGEPEALPDPYKRSEEEGKPWDERSEEEREAFQREAAAYHRRNWEIEEFRKAVVLHERNAQSFAELNTRAEKLANGAARWSKESLMTMLLLMDVLDATRDNVHASNRAASSAADIFERQRDPNYKYR